MVDGGGSKNENGFELPRRKALKLPVASFIGYGALRKGVDKASADPELKEASAEAVSTTTIETVELPSQADSISMTGAVEAWVSASSGDPSLALYAGDEQIFDLQCTPDKAGSGCYKETDVHVEVSADLSEYTGEEIAIEYFTTHNGNVTFVDGPIEFTVDGEPADISEFPLPEISGPRMTIVGKGTAFSINDEQLGVSATEWTFTSPDTDDEPDDYSYNHPTVTFEAPGEYTVTADPIGNDSDAVAETTVVVVGQPERAPAATAIHDDEQPTLSYAFEVPSTSIDIDAFDFDAWSIIEYRNDTITTELLSIDAVEDHGEYDGDGYVADITLTGDASTDIDVPGHENEAVPGLGYSSNFQLKHDGDTLFTSDSVETYAFQEVDQVGLVAAHPNSSNRDKTDETLFDDLRTKSEFLNEYYASGLGSMGGKGFNVHLLNEQHQSVTNDGWIELDDDSSEFGGKRAYGFVEGALQKAEETFPDSVSIASDYDTAFVVSPDLQGDHPFYGGNPAPVDSSALELVFGSSTIEIASILVDDYSPVQPTTIDSGTIDTVYTGIDIDAWRHEFGHAAGPENLIGLPDMYYDARPFTLGTVQNWGLMGNGETMTAFSRLLGGDLYHSSNQWLESDTSAHFLDISLSLSPLTTKELGESMKLVLSSWLEFEVGYDLFPVPNVDLNPYNPKIAPYVLEARKSGESEIEDPFNSNDLVLSGDAGSDPGVAIHRFTMLEFDSQEIMKSFLEGSVSHVLTEGKEDIVGLNYLSRDGIVSSEFPGEPTLSTESDDYDTKEDPETHTKFSVAGGVDCPEVQLERSELDLVETPLPDNPIVKTVIAKIGDFFTDLGDELGGQLSTTDELPMVDLLVETDDGQRAGFDPQTGSVINEIDGAKIIRNGTSRGVVVAGEENFEVTVSADRLKAELQDRGISPPEQVEYERITIVDNDTTVEDRDGVPYLSGRMKQRATAETGTETSALTTVDATFQPSKLNTKSQGNFVTAHVEIPDGFDASDLVLEGLVVDTVQAITDDQYGFVQNIPEESQQGTDYAIVKFPRDALIDQLGVGEHRVSLFGMFGQSSVTATGELTVFDPQDDSEAGGNSQGNGNGNGSPNGTPGNGKSGGPGN